MRKYPKVRRVHTDKFGRKLKSGFEVKVAIALGKEYCYDDMRLPYTLEESTYTPDFAKGTVIIEAKGKFTGADRRKMVAVKKAHPKADIRLVFMRDNKLNKKSKTTYTMWAKAKGFPCSVFPKLPLGEITPRPSNFGKGRTKY